MGWVGGPHANWLKHLRYAPSPPPPNQLSYGLFSTTCNARPPPPAAVCFQPPGMRAPPSPTSYGLLSTTCDAHLSHPTSFGLFSTTSDASSTAAICFRNRLQRGAHCRWSKTGEEWGVAHCTCGGERGGPCIAGGWDGGAFQLVEMIALWVGGWRIAAGWEDCVIAAVICIGIVDLLFVRRFMIILIGKADGNSNASAISFATNSPGLSVVTFATISSCLFKLILGLPLFFASSICTLYITGVITGSYPSIARFFKSYNVIHRYSAHPLIRN